MCLRWPGDDPLGPRLHQLKGLAKGKGGGIATLHHLNMPHGSATLQIGQKRSDYLERSTTNQSIRYAFHSPLEN